MFLSLIWNAGLWLIVKQDIIAICARWASQTHLEVDDIASLPLFKNTLVLSHSEYNKAAPKNLEALLRCFLWFCNKANPNGQNRRRLEETSLTEACSGAVVITRPPEIFTVFYIPTHTGPRSKIFAIFDSHPRPSKGALGASFVLFSTLADTSDYITSLLQIEQSLFFGSLQWEAQLLSHYSGHIFLARNSDDGKMDDMGSMYDANMEVLKLKSRLLDADEISRGLRNEISALYGQLAKLADTPVVKHAHEAENPFRRRETEGPRKSRSPVAGPSNYFDASVKHGSSSSKELSRYNNRQSFSGSKTDHDEAGLGDWQRTELGREQSDWEVARRAQEELDREHIELISQMDRLKGMAQVLFECPICFETHPEDFVAQIDACRHKLCRNCMKRFMTSKLEEHRYPILCPICQTTENVKDPGGTRALSSLFYLHSSGCLRGPCGHAMIIVFLPRRLILRVATTHELLFCSYHTWPSGTARADRGAICSLDWTGTFSIFDCSQLSQVRLSSFAHSCWASTSFIF